MGKIRFNTRARELTEVRKGLHIKANDAMTATPTEANAVTCTTERCKNAYVYPHTWYTTYLANPPSWLTDATPQQVRKKSRSKIQAHLFMAQRSAKQERPYQGKIAQNRRYSRRLHNGCFSNKDVSERFLKRFLNRRAHSQLTARPRLIPLYWKCPWSMIISAGFSAMVAKQTIIFCGSER